MLSFSSSFYCFFCCCCSLREVRRRCGKVRHKESRNFLETCKCLHEANNKFVNVTLTCYERVTMLWICWFVHFLFQIFVIPFQQSRAFLQHSFLDFFICDFSAVGGFEIYKKRLSSDFFFVVEWIKINLNWNFNINKIIQIFGSFLLSSQIKFHILWLFHQIRWELPSWWWW
jgi:hypothetical protein